jgi:hypothetical protein
MRAAFVLLDLAVADVDGAVRVLGDVALVRDQDDGVAVRVQPLEQAHDLLARGAVQVAGGLVRQQDGRGHHESAGDGDALALAARQLVRAVVDALAQLDHLQRLAGAGETLFLGDAGVDERQLHVVQRGRARQQVEGLEDEADLAVAHGRQLVVVHLGHHVAVQHVAALRGRVQAADDVHERRLARARRPHHRHVLALRDLERDAAQRVDLFGAHDVRAPQVDRLDERGLAGLHLRLLERRETGAHLAAPFLSFSSCLIRASFLSVRNVL